MKIAIASDKSGFKLKEKVKKYLSDKGWEVEDAGLNNPDEYMSYYDASDNLCSIINSKKAERGILICGTGAGMCINANKNQGIFAVACESIFAARMCRIVNNANVMTMGANIIGPGKAFEMCDAFLNTSFTEGMSQERSDYLKRLYSDFIEFLN